MQGEGSPRELLGTLSCRLAYTVWPVCNAYTEEKAELGKQTATASPNDTDPSESGIHPAVLILSISSETPLPKTASPEVRRIQRV